MSAKIVAIVYALAYFIQIALTEYNNRAALDLTYGLHGRVGPGLTYDGRASPGYDGLGWAGKDICDGIHHSLAPAVDITPTSGGGLVVTSGSPIAPTGISVVSDNEYEGALTVAGEVPFVGTTAVEGLMPTAGAGAINHSCGDGDTKMISEITDISTTAVVATEPAVIAPVTLGFKATGPSLATPFTPRNGLGLGNRFDQRGCGNRGLMY